NPSPASSSTHVPVISVRHQRRQRPSLVTSATSALARHQCSSPASLALVTRHQSHQRPSPAPPAPVTRHQRPSPVTSATSARHQRLSPCLPSPVIMPDARHRA
ncbi:hypothetical protein CRG98_049459, partial [Punica granatum]